MAEICKLLEVRQIQTSIYHPKTNGLVEQLKQHNIETDVGKDDSCRWEQL
jgi:hypothetical protein